MGSLTLSTDNPGVAMRVTKEDEREEAAMVWIDLYFLAASDIVQLC